MSDEEDPYGYETLGKVPCRFCGNPIRSEKWFPAWWYETRKGVLTYYHHPCMKEAYEKERASHDNTQVTQGARRVL